MKTALIIGGSKGIGLEIARTFTKRGDKVTVLSRNKSEWDGEFIQADLTDHSSLEKSISFIRINKLHFNYIVFSQKNRAKPDDIETEARISIQSTQYLLENLIPNAMVNGGAVVFIGSPSGTFITQEQPVAYHICKAALEHLAKYYAVSFGKYSITFNCVLPGTILKESNRDFYNDNNQITDLLKSITPLNKLGEAQDIANAVSFFCSNNANFITGQSILVDGGRSLEGHESLARRLMGV
ncbi:MAG: SDR family NAD(P)-dependent oxidoreductase [Gammaproteobacteria bacterium]|nr:SDR family NAD(P)-dependent oxidoreductase [Gammaproteobacteria bacterium]